MEIGDLVRWHDSGRKGMQSGIIIEKRELTDGDQSEKFEVMWSNGKIRLCSRWQLFGINK